jgi:hypothetical protein
MQYLLDFIQEHSLDAQLYFLARSPADEFELLWRRAECADYWQLRPKHREGPSELVDRHKLIDHLTSRGVDMTAVKRELNAMLAVQIAFADMVLRDADQQLGRNTVQRFVLEQRTFMSELQAAVEQLTGGRQNMGVVQGGGAQTTLRTGHLSIVR